MNGSIIWTDAIIHDDDIRREAECGCWPPFPLIPRQILLELPCISWVATWHPTSWGKEKSGEVFSVFQPMRRGSLGNSAAELSAAGCEGCSSVVYAKLFFFLSLVFWSVLSFRTSAMFIKHIKPRIGEIGDLNNVRLTGYLILVVAVLIIFGGIKHLGYNGSHGS